MSSGAVDPPRPRVELSLGRRHHRRFTVPSGLLLFACMFLPAVKGCSAPVYPLEMPMFLPPYLYGLAFAVGALSLSARAMRHTITAVRAITVITIMGSGVLLLVAPGLGLVEMLAGALLLAAIGWGGHSERRAASAATLIGALCTTWFGLWASTPDALLGVYLSFAASVGLLLGGLVWLGETAVVPVPPIVIPRAVARRRD